MNGLNIELLDNIENNNQHLDADGCKILAVSSRSPLSFKIGDFIITKENLMTQFMVFIASILYIVVKGIIFNTKP